MKKSLNITYRALYRFSQVKPAKQTEELDADFEKFITEEEYNRNDKQKEIMHKFEREWEKLYKDSRQDQYKTIDDALNEYEKKKVEFLGDAVLKLNIMETRYFTIMIRDQILRTTGFNPLKVNTNWPLYKKLEENPFPLSDVNFEKRQEAMARLMPIGVPGFTGLMAGLGGGAPQKVEQKEEVKKEEVKEEKKERTHFDLELTAFDAAQKIKIIKEVRQLLGLGLKEAKDMVEKAPVCIKKDVPKEEAESLLEKLKASGCTITLK